jgi:hypothetical protein
MRGTVRPERACRVQSMRRGHYEAAAMTLLFRIWLANRRLDLACAVLPADLHKERELLRRLR